MMIRSFRALLAGCAALGAVTTLALSAAPARAQTAFALADGGTSLFSFNAASTGAIATTAIGSFGGVTLSAIDFRAATGVLYGYSDGNDTVYTVDTTNGTLTAITPTTAVPGTTTGLLGIDFNPTTPAGSGLGQQFRIVTAANENAVFNVTTGAYAGGVNPITGATLVENAYTNNLAGSTTTTQYAVNDANDTLVILNNNAGTVAQVGTGQALGIAVSGGNVGFDIFTTAGGVNTAYLLSGNDFYTVSTATGVASPLLGTLSGVTNVRSLAITPVVVPEAGALPLLMGGVLSAGVGIAARRRRAAE